METLRNLCGRIVCEPQSGLGYLGMEQINTMVRSSLVRTFAPLYDSCAPTTKIFLKRTERGVVIQPVLEKDLGEVFSCMHISLFYPNRRLFVKHSHTTFLDLFPLPKSKNITMDQITQIYQQAISPAHRFTISGVQVQSGINGRISITSSLVPSAIIDQQGRALSGSDLHLTLARIDSWIQEPERIAIVAHELQDLLVSTQIKVGNLQNAAHLTFAQINPEVAERVGQRRQ